MIHNGDPLDLAGADKETITVTVTSTKAVVDLVLNGQVFTGTQITLDKAKADPWLLSVGGVFTDTKNGCGAFSVSLFGGAVATKAVAQFSPAEARRSFTFTIDVV